MLAALYAVSVFVLLVYGLNLLWLSVKYAAYDREQSGPVPDPDEVPRPDRSWPVVTVQLPLYNEPYVVERLIDACAGLVYPRDRLEIQVLDDSTDRTTELAARRVALWQGRGLDIVHIRRSAREGYKAGALQNGLRLARGTLCALFDADFLPQPDFLQRTVPHFRDPQVGLVQARWGHRNADASLLTQIQAFGLDTHFAVEQHVRAQAGYFINFNGTAGVWRRRCIEDAGGWQSDTLTEDLDLSYRAQLAGWTFHYLPEVEVPAELPADIGALRAQQFRWTKGAAETSLKLLGRLWRSGQPFHIKLEGTIHLTAHFVFPFLLLVALLHAPLLFLKHQGYGPGEAYFAAMGIGLLGFAGFFLAQLFAQRALYPDWSRRLYLFPLFMAGSMAMALSNTQAIGQALRRKRSPFVRTPKFSGRRPPQPPRAAGARRAGIAWAEAALGLYCVGGLVALTAAEAWSALPFQALFVLGFGLLTACNLQGTRWRRRAR